MTEANPYPISYSEPGLLGSPELTAFRAFAVIGRKQPPLSDEDSERLGALIYEGRLAERRLSDPDMAIELEEYFELEQQAEDGRSARREVTTRHLPLVIGLSGKFAYNQQRQLNEDRRAEMTSVGNLALLKCLEGYIPIPGRHMTPFIRRSIQNAMIMEVMNNIRSTTGRSVRMQRTLLQVDTAYKQATEAGEDATFLEVADRLGFKEERMLTIWG